MCNNIKRSSEVSSFLRQRLMRWISVLGKIPMDFAISFERQAGEHMLDEGFAHFGRPFLQKFADFIAMLNSPEARDHPQEG